MSGHENCSEGVYCTPPVPFEAKKYLHQSLLESSSQTSGDYKDRVIDDLVTALKAYAAIREPEDREWFFWNSHGEFCFEDKFGCASSAGGPEIAIKKLKEYNLL